MSEKTFRLKTLGCRTNQYETQRLRGQLIALGYHEAAEGEPAEISFVNTCTVTASADQSSRAEIRKLLRVSPETRMVVTGCLAEKEPELIGQIPGVSLVVSNQDKEQLVTHLFPEEKELPELSITHFEGHTRAFVKVQDGCNSFCTYCIIPYVRGRSRSREIAPIIEEIQQLIASGYKEVVITGINVGDFAVGDQQELKLADLLEKLYLLPGLERVRLSSIDPDEVDERLMEAILKGKNTCHSLHLVLQSGSNVLLKRMNRKYTRQVFLETVEKLRAADPDFTFTTDIIVGFPGETEIDFEETLAVMREVQFAKVHFFPYSPRDRTRAALYPNRVPPEVMRARKSRLLRLAEETAFVLRARYVGRTLRVLTEQSNKEGGLFGHTDNFLPVQLPKGESLLPNQLLSVVLTENTAESLIGSPVL